MLVGEQAPPSLRVEPPATRANAWEDVADLSASFGVRLDPWQEVVLQAAMGERSDGTWSAKQIGLSAPRQNGKSQMIVARALAGALLFGEKKIVISAHAQDTARETFAKFLDQIEDSPALAERVEKVMNALNREFIKFHNGAVVQFKARTVSGSRGFSADCLLLDEAQILGMPAWVSINSTMSARPNPQIWLLGTPPTPEDNGEVFTSLRNSAKGGKSKTLAWLEWAASPDDDPALASTRAKANPAWHTRINHEVVQGEFETYPAARFALDRLGIWDDEAGRPLVMPIWPLCATTREAPRPKSLGVAVDPDRVWVSVGAHCEDGDRRHLGAVMRRRLDVDRELVTAEVLRIQAERQVTVVIDRKGPASSLGEQMETAGVAVTWVGLDEYVTSCAEVFDGIAAKEIEHGDYPELNDAVKAASKRKVGERWAWARTGGDVSMLEAVTLAYGGRDTASVYDSRDMVVL